MPLLQFNVQIQTNVSNSQKFYKLKKESEKLLTGAPAAAPGGNTAPNPATAPNTPKAKVPRTPKSGKASAGKRKKNPSNDVDDEATTMESPSKKVKAEAGTEDDVDSSQAGDDIKTED